MADEDADEAENTAGNPTYAAFLAEQVKTEETRKGSLEARGVTTITTSGALATVLLGIVTLTKGKEGTISLPEPSRPWVVAALVAFVVATIFSIATNAPVSLSWTDPDEWSELIDEIWQDDEATSQRNVAGDHLDQLKALNRWNNWKGYALIVAMVSQAVAIILVAIAVQQAL
jgi:hypothetical protein